MSKSALYVGSVMHARRGAARHGFRYPLYMLYLDLDELASLKLDPVLGVERPGLLSFRRKDYRGSAERPLKEVIFDDVERVLGERPNGPVRLLTHVRSLGPAFNPVSFYYCFERDGRALQAVVAEITNTPWNERHAYVLRAEQGAATASFDKAFHVSPFLPMEQRYHWHLPEPGGVLAVEMRNEAGGHETFRAELSLERRPLTKSSLLRAALSAPFMSLRVLAAIYWQALRLWLKRAPFFSHPAKRSDALARNEA